MKNTVISLQKQKADGNKITMVTAYDYTIARLAEEAGIETILVGDSLGMVMMGYDDTLPVTMEDIIHHTSCVTRACKDTFVIGDMPFMSYQASVEEAVINAGRLIKEGHANAVKLEGGASVCAQIVAITKASIPVCAHIGLTPQSVNAFGGFKVQGKSLDAAKQLILDAKAVEEAGAFMVVLEGIPAKLAEIISKEVSIPTIGIGAGAGCDGQVLVFQDMMTMSHLQPQFVKHFANLGEEIKNAFLTYSKEVKAGVFPDETHCYSIDEEVINNIKKEQ